MGLELEEQEEKAPIEAFNTIIAALQPLTDDERKRVLKAAITLLDVDLEY